MCSKITQEILPLTVLKIGFIEVVWTHVMSASSSTSVPACFNHPDRLSMAVIPVIMVVYILTD
jgi:hypothetical protein